jgi:hypothetical protein
MPTQAVVEAISEKPVEVASPVRERMNAVNRALTLDTSAVFDESDLDIPAFIREHRNRQ